MKRFVYRCRFGLAGLLLFSVSLCAGPQPALARPKYLKAFATKYKNLLAQAKKQKCNVCHYGKTKKNRNDFGQALMKHVGKNEKDTQKIDAALSATEKDNKPGSEKTFGDLIKAGKLPGTNPE